MMAEEDKARRGEPVIVTLEDGREMPGTIEWGDAVHRDMSVYLEKDGHSGGRVQIRCGLAHRVRPDPGAARPVWASIR
jgi:small nuclear ribonucleoprotein (snRNP)-like protein